MAKANSMEQAIGKGAIAPFTNKYREKVLEKTKPLPPDDSGSKGYSSGGRGGYRSRGGSGGSGGGGGGGAPKTTTSIDYDYTSRWDATAIMYAGLTQVLGRNPNGKELRAYLKSLKAFEKKHPTKTVTTTNADGTTQSSVQTGGLSEAGRSQWTENWLEKKFGAESSAYKQATTYFDVFAKSLGSAAGSM